VELSSQDPEVLKEYAESLQDPDEKAAVLTKIIALNPNLTDARYELGLITAQKGRVAAGIRMVEDAIAYQADPDVLRNYVQGLINLLDEVKCPLPDAEQWDTKLNQAYDKATQAPEVRPPCPISKRASWRLWEKNPVQLLHCFEHRLMGLRCQPADTVLHCTML
jgi:tetratricopeptide (TPR) repeat protein